MKNYQKLRNSIVSQFPNHVDEVDLLIASVLNKSSVLLQGKMANEFSNVMKVITSSIEPIGKPPHYFKSDVLIRELSNNMSIDSLPEYIVIRDVDLESESQISILNEIVKRCAVLTSKWYETNDSNLSLLASIPVQIFKLDDVSIPKQVTITTVNVDLNVVDYLSGIGFTTDSLTALKEIVDRCKKFVLIPDSKIKEGTTILKIVALLRGREHIDIEELELMKYILPNDEDQYAIVTSIISNVLSKY